MSDSSEFGKKVFFLYPGTVVREIASALAAKEYEVYMIRDHRRFKKALSRFPNSIVFINLDDGPGDKGWEPFVAALQRELPEVAVGVLTLSDVTALREKYVRDLKVACGFTSLKIGAAKAVEILAKTLESKGAKGRRRFVRANCLPGTGKVNLDVLNTTIEAELNDISSAGMSISLASSTDFNVGTVLKSISISVLSVRLIVSAIVVAKRAEPSPAHVVLFDPASTDESRRAKLKDLVFRLNQASMERLLETV